MQQSNDGQALLWRHPNYRDTLSRTVPVLLLLAFIQLLAWLIPSLPEFKGIPNYLPLHVLLETVSIVVSMMVFAVGWNSRSSNLSGNVVLLASVFFAVGVLDFLHTVSYGGMPDFISPNDSEKHLNFWLSARFFASVVLLVVAIRPWKPLASAATRYIIFGSLLAVTAMINWVVIYHQPWLPDTFIPGQGLTAFKKNTEYLIIALNVVAAVILWNKMRKPQTFNVVLLFAAVCTLAMSEFFFTLYTTMTGSYNVLGHVYKVIAYLFIYRAIVVETIEEPYNKLALAQQNLATALQASNTGLWDWDLRTDYVFYSPEWKAQIGYLPDELPNQLATWESLLHPDDRAPALEKVQSFLKSSQQHYENEFRLRHRDGSYRWVMARGEKQYDAEGNTVRLIGSHIDISERKHAEENQARLNRSLKLLSDCNMALVHAEEESKLLSEICRLIVEQGGYRLAWVGFAEHDAEKNVQPVAQFGDLHGYLGRGKIMWSDTERGRGPTGTAIRSGLTDINQDYANPRMVIWREAALARGYRSSIALPLIVNGRVLGALTIYASETDAFNPEEVKLLEELANDLAYGIATLRTRVEHEEAEKQLAYLAHHDMLTGLPNRLLLRDRFDRAAAQADREQSGVAVLFLDLDNFKQVNDTLGHNYGDQLLVRVVERLRGCLRETDTVSRQGGDEFVVLLPNLRDLDLIGGIAQSIIEAYSEPFGIEHYSISTTFSIGVSLYPDDGREFDMLLKKADTAMYQSKDSGRDTYRFFAEKMNADAHEQMQLQGQLHNAIRNQEFLLHYQPQVSIESDRIVGAEALVRWQHPELGLIPPGKFIPLAERSGLVIPMGEWVLNEACRQARQWLEDGRPLVVAVNLSALQFRRGNLLETVSNALKLSGLPAEMLELELTESILLQDVDVAIKTLHSLKTMGVQLSIDDFGTGYSSLSYLKRLAVNKLKVDQSFVRDMAEDPDSAAIVRAIIQLGHTLQLSVIAEGVENDAQLAFLRNYGCDEVQGYFFSRPVPSDEFVKLLEK